jgi:hypothetical protein
MTSSVNNYSSLIDTSFPIPGADNDTQGFRDNFGNILLALNTASMEISELQIINSALISLASDAPTSPTGKDGDIQGQIYATTGTVYICTASYDTANTSSNIWAQITANWPWI